MPRRATIETFKSSDMRRILLFGSTSAAIGWPLDSSSSKPAWIDAWAHIKRGNAYDAKGDRNKAVFEYNKALQTGSNYDNAQSVAKKFIETPFDPKATEAAQATPGH